MALQGTLDTFALPDVLQLLAATKKTGCLRLSGSRGSGTVSVEGGGIVGVRADHAPRAVEPAAALFELLRFEDGSFSFDPDSSLEAAGPAEDADALLDAAGALLAEWREIESIVPSLDAWVTLRRTLSADAVTIAADRWPTVVAIGPGRTVGQLGDELDLAELPVSRAVRDLVELGVAEVELREAAPSAVEERPDTAPSPVDDVTEPFSPVVAPAGDDDLPRPRPIRARRPRPRTADTSDGVEERFVPLDLPGHAPSPASLAGSVAEEREEDGTLDDLAAAFPGLSNRPSDIDDEIGGEDDEEDEAEVARQLEALSPRAADAVRLAATSEEVEEEPEPEADAPGPDGPINRGLLLKFLGSVKS